MSNALPGRQSGCYIGRTPRPDPRQPAAGWATNGLIFILGGGPAILWE